MAKYGNKKCTYNGMTFDSRKEMKRYIELEILERAGKIKGLRRQVPFTLIPSQYEYYERYGKNGKRLKDGKRCIENSVKYIADFVYERGGEMIVEDTKGKRTPDYILKRKMLLYLRHIKIYET